jgi:pectate lyase
MNREFRLAAGNYSVSAPISLSSNARISGTGSTTITVGANQVSSIFKIESSATAVALKNLILKEGGGLSTGHLSLEGGNSNIVIDQVRFVGDTTKGSITAAAIRAPRELVSNVTVNNSIFEYMPYGFSSNANVTDLTITNSDFSGWTHYAILISPGSASTGTRSERITINSNYFHHPDVGPDGQALLLITRGTSRQCSRFPD